MEYRQFTIPIDTTLSVDKKLSAGKNSFPHASAFVENFDTDEQEDTANILSFESLRDAFAAIQQSAQQSAELSLDEGFAAEPPSETKIAQTIQNLQFFAEDLSEAPELSDLELPDYAFEYSIENKFDNERESAFRDSCSNNVYPSVITKNADTHTSDTNTADRNTASGPRLETIIEAMLFMGDKKNRPLLAERIAEKLRNVSEEDVEQAVNYLNGCYQKRNCPYVISATDGGYSMVLRSEFESVRSNFYGKTREVRLTQQAIDTLAIVAYRQPLTEADIQKIRKQPSSALLNKLVRQNLIQTTHSEDGKTVQYNTTSRFLDLLQIESLDDIPKIDEWDYR